MRKKAKNDKTGETERLGGMAKKTRRSGLRKKGEREKTASTKKGKRRESAKKGVFALAFERKI